MYFVVLLSLVMNCGSIGMSHKYGMETHDTPIEKELKSQAAKLCLTSGIFILCALLGNGCDSEHNICSEMLCHELETTV
jgi:hypothetical protein